MSVRKHSPLPWGLWKSHPTEIFSDIEDQSSSHITGTAICVIDDLMPKAEQKANAAYIVEASNAYPSLTADLTAKQRRIDELEAMLRKTADCLEENQAQFWTGEYPPEVIEAARALLNAEDSKEVQP